MKHFNNRYQKGETVNMNVLLKYSDINGKYLCTNINGKSFSKQNVADNLVINAVINVKLALNVFTWEITSH